ncbi:MAG: hypothetical protein EBU46_07915 [Nitrosomonadaceae bacterium]|nr:hypothetical protein [Nitrosomonadaceae bacterium]
MARKRTVLVDQDEDIVAYEHHLPGKFVRVAIGFGTIMPDDSFVVAENQNYENFIIQDVAYDSLMAANDTKPEGVFRKNDLWIFVDIWRQKLIAERQAIADAEAKKAAAVTQPKLNK